MDLSLIERLMKMLSDSELATLEVTEGNLKIRLSKVASPVVPPQHAAAGHAPAERGQIPAGPLTHVVHAGLAGTFYRAPNPGAEPFVRQGQQVRDGDCLALIEAMKMLNPIESEIDGIVTRILLEDGTPVQAGTALIEIQVSP